MAPDMSAEEVATLKAPQQGNGQAATLEAKLDEFLGPVTSVLMNGVSASLMSFFPLERVAHRLAFLLGRTLSAGFQASDLPMMLRFRAEIKKQFHDGIASVPASVAIAGHGQHQQPAARPPG